MKICIRTLSEGVEVFSAFKVKRELEGVIKSVPQANILLHDTFYQSEESGYNVGPYKAVVDVLAGMPNRYKIISQNIGLPGMTLLRRD